MVRFLPKNDSNAGRGIERRRSHRVSIELPVQIGGLGSARLLDLSLGGAAIETSSKVFPGARLPLRLQYDEARVDLTLQAYRTRIKDLFYSPHKGSRVRYRVRATFEDPSIAALNLVYRIMREHWVPPGYDDDTEPFEDAESTPSPHLVSLGA